MHSFLTFRPHLGAWRGLCAFSLALLSLGASLRAQSFDPLGAAWEAIPPEWFDSLPSDRAAHLCAAWGLAFRNAGQTAQAHATRRLALICLLRRRDLSPATYARWLLVFPDDDFLLNAAAWPLLIAEDRPDAALPLLLRIPPHRRDAETLDTLACTLLRLGRPADALQASLASAEAASREGEPIHPLLFEHLGNALYANGFHREALTAWRTARREARAFPGGDDALIVSGYDDARLLRAIRALRRLSETNLPATSLPSPAAD